MASSTKNTTISKGLKYSVVTKIVNFNPEKHKPKIIIVNGGLAVHLKGNIYTKM